MVLNIDGFMASNGCCKRLKARYPILGSRVAQGFERTRVGALNPEQTQKYMELVREAINKVEELNGGVKFSPNLDETGFDPVNNQDMEVICEKLAEEQPTQSPLVTAHIAVLQFVSQQQVFALQLCTHSKVLVACIAIYQIALKELHM